jgi:hypothetical protein
MKYGLTWIAMGLFRHRDLQGVGQDFPYGRAYFVVLSETAHHSPPRMFWGFYLKHVFVNILLIYVPPLYEEGPPPASPLMQFAKKSDLPFLTHLTVV